MPTIDQHAYLRQQPDFEDWLRSVSQALEGRRRSVETAPRAPGGERQRPKVLLHRALRLRRSVGGTLFSRS
jgi:hypothetical protein